MNLGMRKRPHPVITKEHKLIVLHTPKCAGTSLLKSLRTAFGIPGVYNDYPHQVPRGDESRGPEDYPVIFGHFAARKYQHIENAMWVTLLREPVDRVLSLYFNWRFTPFEMLQNEPRKTGIRRKVRDGRIELLEFAQRRGIADSMHERYFGGFDMGRFNLIIIHSSYAAGVQQLSQRIDAPLLVEHKNVSSSRSDAYMNERRRIESDPKIMQNLREILQKEIEFYEYATSLPTAVHGKVEQDLVPAGKAGNRLANLESAPLG